MNDETLTNYSDAPKPPGSGDTVFSGTFGEPDLSGMTLDNYALVRKIAEGGMGVIYEAVQTKLSRKVAIKVLTQKLSTRPQFYKRFEREAKAAAALNHPNLVQVYDFGVALGRHYMVMEFIEGEDLAQYVERVGKLPVDQALNVVEQAALALKAASAKSIIHRDIKPSNLMLTSEGVVKVSDLGLAKILTEDSDMTATGVGMGSPHFIAPEQADDSRNVDHRADIYALGLTLLYLLTGKKPFDGGTPFSIVLAHVKKPLPSGVDLGTELPAEVEAFIRRMSAKNPDERYLDYDALLADLANVRAGVAPVAVASASSATAGTASRKTWLVGMGVGVTAVGMIALFLARRPATSPKYEVNSAPAPTLAASPAPPSEATRSIPPDAVEDRRSPPETERGFPDRPREGQRPPGGMRLPMGPPTMPDFAAIPDGPLETMLAVADQYAAEHPSEYNTIITRYRQLEGKAEGTPLQPEIDRKVEAAVAAHQRAAQAAIQQYESKMLEKAQAGQPQEAFSVWRDFPPGLRTREVDNQIRESLKKALPADFSPDR